LDEISLDVERRANLASEREADLIPALTIVAIMSNFAKNNNEKPAKQYSTTRHEITFKKQKLVRFRNTTSYLPRSKTTYLSFVSNILPFVNKPF